MRKKTSANMGLVMATILIAYIAAFTLSNQAFAQVHMVMPGKIIIVKNRNLDGTQLGKIFGSHSGLGCDPWDPRGC
jgi:hypothetical protein